MTDYPLKVQFTGKLRDRVTERNKQYAAEEDSDYVQDCNNVLTRQKTNIVIQNEREREHITEYLKRFTGKSSYGITWLNGPMRSAAERIVEQINQA